MTNPLLDHFRKTEITIPLPSRGQFYSEGSLTMNADNEVGIRSMRVRDEIEIKGADVLYNGEALYHLIESCVPSITNAREMPIFDVDPVLLGVKYASYGKKIDLSVTCSKCKEENKFEADLTTLLHKIVPKEGLSDNVLVYEGAKITVKPFTLESSVRQQALKASHNMLIKSLDDPNIDEDRQKELFNEVLVSSAKMLNDIIAKSIISVQLSDDSELINDEGIIYEWVSEMGRDLHAKVKHKINDLSRYEFDTTMNGTCQHCDAAFTTAVEVNPFTFFSESF